MYLHSAPSKREIPYMVSVTSISLTHIKKENCSKISAKVLCEAECKTIFPSKLEARKFVHKCGGLTYHLNLQSDESIGSIYPT